MADLLLDAQSEPATPASGQLVIWPDIAALMPMAKNANGLVFPQSGFVTTLAADFTGTNVNTAQPIFPAAVDTITLQPGTYLMKGVFHIHTTGTSAHTLALLFGGTAVVQDIGYCASASNAATEVLGALNAFMGAAATAVVITASLSSASHHSVWIDGVVRISAAGTFIPQYQWSAAPGVAGVTLRDGYFQLIPIGTAATAAVGPWA